MIIDEAIKKLKFGIRDNVTLYEKTVSKMIDNINDVLKENHIHIKKSKIS